MSQEMLVEYVVPAFQPEEVDCLGPCGKKFMSWNKKYNRICPECKVLNNPPEFEVPEKYWDELDDTEIELDPEYWDFINDLS
jgi:hypothetical protein